MNRRLAFASLAAGVAACATGATLEKEVEALQQRLDRAWEDGGYRCSPVALANAEAHVVFVRAELDQGDPVRAARHRRAAQLAMATVREELRRCPSLLPDRDGDGVADVDDECPEIPGLAEHRGCPDGDGDGIIDKVDRCPETPEDADGHDDEDGCPEGDDRDGDGVADPDDGCPDVVGPVQNAGCPYGDTDGDGLEDDVDQCPKAVEDVDDFEDEDGCPDPDNDNDGVLDADDRCPMLPETVNEFEDDDGCPDVESDLVRVNRDIGKLEIEGRVYFATGRARIRDRSFEVLDEIARVLKANPTMSVLIEGHTDAVGPNHSNLQLSQERADAVRAYLIDKGVGANRLTAIGFGEEKPIDSNRTRRGRERNRRVEFTITTE